MVVAVFTGNPYFTILAAIGAMIPDLDREYLLGDRATFKEEQWHRSLFHNLLFFAGVFFINEWLALGAFLHSLLDAFTTVKDRGVEWLFPFSRIVKRGRYSLGPSEENDKCTVTLLDQNPPDRVYFYNEDSPELTKLADPDLEETKAVPWRRTYGPALNGKLVDTWFFIGSLTLLVLYSLVNQRFVTGALNYILSAGFLPALFLAIAIGVTYAGGVLRLKGKSKIAFSTLFATAAVFFILSAFFSLKNLSAYSFSLSLEFVVPATAILLLEAILVWRYMTRGGRQAVV
jgi:hypothetical protein